MTPDEQEYVEAKAAYHAAVARLQAAKARVPAFLEAEKKRKASAAHLRQREREQAEERQRRSTWPEWLIAAKPRVQSALRWLAHENHGTLSINMIRAAGRNHWAFSRLNDRSLAELDTIVGHW